MERRLNSSIDGSMVIKNKKTRINSISNKIITVSTGVIRVIENLFDEASKPHSIGAAVSGDEFIKNQSKRRQIKRTQLKIKIITSI
jgi:hypothetical protein